MQEIPLCPCFLFGMSKQNKKKLPVDLCGPTLGKCSLVSTGRKSSDCKVNFQGSKARAFESLSPSLGRVPFNALSKADSRCASPKTTFTLLCTFAYKVKAEKTCFTLIVCSFIIRVDADLRGSLPPPPPPLPPHTQILLPFLKTGL